MKKLLFLIVLITLPVLTFGQNASNDTVKQNDIITIEAITVQEIAENQIAFGTFSRNDVVNLSYKKSNDLISIKAYRKSLQIRTREVKAC
ncbi:hypothetical protein [Gelidibacter gilvus]|uniref:Uncharacterized protein n=1 Tax=Gelidibacter gilvus TaxID=59602 RepID=A0A4Q0XKJ7_9FLAO|nr:hypothetical protein [Gelidibacter gilvus]RXJ52768.1 hypothetical protein ESZ48_03495 [Gelidibacter gilvus]